MTGDDVVRIIWIVAALVLVTTSLRGRKIGLSDGLRMGALWTFAFVTLALLASILGW